MIDNYWCFPSRIELFYDLCNVLCFKLYIVRCDLIFLLSSIMKLEQKLLPLFIYNTLSVGTSTFPVDCGKIANFENFKLHVVVVSKI